MPEAPDEIKELVEKFHRNLEAYKNPSYKEEQLKQEFINPFFKALGWDVDNVSGAAPQYRDVIFEDSIKVGGGTKAPDYCFTLAGRKMFFVEAKKPSVNVKMSIEPSYQLRRYAWSAKLPLSILTDFEELAVYDSRAKPQKKDRASTGRIMFLTYQDYLEKWNDIYSIFSREAVLQGSFDIFAESTKKKRGTTEVDDAFLSEIEEWRDLFAKNIALRNPDITIDELNYAVQQTIDRLVFLRMCEDRGVEKYEQLRNLLDNDDIYRHFGELCLKADEKYNSGLFHFKEEKSRETSPDKLTLDLNIDDRVFKTIIKNLYYPNSPYEFSVLSPEILGNVYEQFLGKVIRLTPGHQAKIEEKPEVKKAGGVYYTPQFIVDYIVENTVGKLCKGKTPNKVSKLRILDPACGSGSFLLGAYTYLLKWHRDYYTNQKDKKRLKDKIYQGKGGEYYLTIREKKRILLNNLYGVDIDPQAVNVTKLSLLLKVLEGENRDALEAQQKLFKERALPDLGNNIKCGNSLIAPDIYDNPDLELTTDDIQRINPFDWESEFYDVMDDGGFDTVIGNPPYIRIQAMKQWAPIEVEQYKNLYQSASKGNYDIYVVFVEKGLSLLNKNGILGFILPHKFFKKEYGKPIRSIISKRQYIQKIVHFGCQQVFKKATTYTCMLFLNKSGFKQFEYIPVDNLINWINTREENKGNINSKTVTDKEWNFIIGPGVDLFNKLNRIQTKLDSIANIFVGLQTSADKVFIMDLVKETSKYLHLHSKAQKRDYKFEKDLFFPLLSGTDVNRYSKLHNRQYILFPYLIKKNKSELIEFKEISTKYPLTAQYLKDNKKVLESREKGKTKGKGWWGYIYLKNMNKQSLNKICVPRLVESLYATYDDGSHYLDNVDVGGVIFKPEYEDHTLEYLLGVLNSKLMRWFFPHVSEPFRGCWWSANKQFIGKLPIRTIKFDNSDDVAIHDRIVTLVEQMLQLHKDLANTKTPDAEQRLQRQIEATDKQIDNLVYKLYGLTEEEIEIIEGV